MAQGKLTFPHSSGRGYKPTRAGRCGHRPLHSCPTAYHSAYCSVPEGGGRLAAAPTGGAGACTIQPSIRGRGTCRAAWVELCKNRRCKMMQPRAAGCIFCSRMQGQAGRAKGSGGGKRGNPETESVHRGRNNDFAPKTVVIINKKRFAFDRKMRGIVEHNKIA